MPSNSFWSTLSESFLNCCTCCRSKELEHDRLTTLSEGTPPLSYPTEYDNPILDIGVEENFSLQVLDTPEMNWNPQLRLRFHEAADFPNDSEELNRESDNVSRTRITNKDKEDEKEESRSVGRESGYGHSIEESLDSENELNLRVTQAGSKATYKVVVESRKKCWIVFRRQLEFVTLQEHIKEQVGQIGTDLPVGARVDVEELQHFLKCLVSDPQVFKIVKVREFLHLDRYKSFSSDSGESTSAITTQPKSGVILNPKKLIQNSYRHNNVQSEQLKKKEKHKLEKVDPEASFPLGCEEKKMSPADFDFLTIIGKGSFGRVMLAKKKDDGHVYAVKMLNKTMILRKNETAHVLSERSALTRVLRHPYIVQLHYAFTTPNKIFFVLDYVNGGELFYHLQKERTFTERRARFYAAEICCALTYMHSKGIVYRDLKPENILLDRDGHVVLTDFGLCKEGFESSFSRTSTFCGTPEYLAPEVILKKPYTRSVDWWTLGAVLYEMLFGLPPFYHKNTTIMYSAIVHKPLKLRPTISAGARDILTLLLQKSPINRLGSSPMDGLEIQSHFFFITMNWDKIEERNVPPPFVPYVTSEEDTRNIDPAFTKERIASVSGSPSTVLPSEDRAFRGFTYVSPDDEEVDR